MKTAPKQPPLELRVDRPFLFAIQHVPADACLFLGGVTDPR
jgi:serine protease inhibitor